MGDPSGVRMLGQAFLNDGGPLLVLPHAQLQDWTGTPDDDPVGGDYARACECEDEAELLVVGAGHGFPLGVTEGVAQASWATDGVHWFVMGVLYGDDEADGQLLHRIQAGEVDWSGPTGTLEISGGLTLLHAASAGADLEPRAPEGEVTSWTSRGEVGIGDALHANVPDGRWSVAHAYVEVEIEPDGGGAWIVARLLPAD